MPLVGSGRRLREQKEEMEKKERGERLQVVDSQAARNSNELLGCWMSDLATIHWR